MTGNGLWNIKKNSKTLFHCNTWHFYVDIYLLIFSADLYWPLFLNAVGLKGHIHI